MPKVLTDGKIRIGAYMLPDRKRPCLCISEGNQSIVYGYFHNIECADEFMNKLGKLVRAEMECENNA